MLAAQDIGNDRRGTANDEAVSIDQQPFLFDLCRFDRLGRLHKRLHRAGPHLERKRAEQMPRVDGGPFAANLRKVKDMGGF